MKLDNSIILTFDVEDWFQVENLKKNISFSSWSERELRVEQNTLRLLDLLEGSPKAWGGDVCKRNEPLRATFFILGWVAERVPHLVREIVARGHEVASHGFYHNLCSEGSLQDLINDLSDSRKLLEDITGSPVHGYRAPSFSISPKVLSLIAECGYTYDSSYNSFAANTRYGRLELISNGCGIAVRVLPSFFELPVSNLEIAGHIIPMGGGGYFRLMPALLFKRAVKSILEKQGSYLFYMHPWEIDPQQPRVKNLPFSYRFRHYVNLDSAASKLVDFISSFGGCRFITCKDYIDMVAADTAQGPIR